MKKLLLLAVVLEMGLAGKALAEGVSGFELGLSSATWKDPSCQYVRWGFHKPGVYKVPVKFMWVEKCQKESGHKGGHKFR